MGMSRGKRREITYRCYKGYEGDEVVQREPEYRTISFS